MFNRMSSIKLLPFCALSLPPIRRTLHISRPVTASVPFTTTGKTATPELPPAATPGRMAKAHYEGCQKQLYKQTQSTTPTSYGESSAWSSEASQATHHDKEARGCQHQHRHRRRYLPPPGPPPSPSSTLRQMATQSRQVVPRRRRRWLNGSAGEWEEVRADGGGVTQTVMVSPSTWRSYKQNRWQGVDQFHLEI